MNNQYNENALARALDELSVLPSFGIVKAWIDDRREWAIASISNSVTSPEELRFLSGYLSMTEEIRENILAHSRGSNSYETTEAPRLGSASGMKGGVK
jgi:hypothetical protein